jgi:hypothetical protein
MKKLIDCDIEGCLNKTEELLCDEHEDEYLISVLSQESEDSNEG